MLRLAILDEFLHENPIAEKPCSDGEVYWNMARHMAGGNWTGETPFLSAPLYPYLLGLIRTLGGGLVSVYLLQIAMHLVTAVLIGWVTRRRFGNLAGLFAIGLFLLLTEPAVSATRILASTLQLLLVVALWWRWATAAERNTVCWKDAIIVGGLIGLLALAYPPAILVVPVFGLWLWAVGRQRQAAFLKGVAGIATALLVISPATLHNFICHGEFIPIAAHGGITLRQGNLPSSKGIGEVIPGVSPRRDEMHEDAAKVFERTYGRKGTWREIDRHFRREALEYWLENPRAALRLFGSKLYLYLTARNYDDMMPIVVERRTGFADRVLLAPLTTPWLLGAALVGLIAVLRRPLHFTPEWLLTLLPLLVVLLFFYAPRYRLPAVPLMCGLAAYALAHCRRLKPPTPLLIGVFLLPLPLYLWNEAKGYDSPELLQTVYSRALSEAQVQAGSRRVAAGQYAQAEKRYRSAIELWKGNFRAHTRLGALYVKQQRIQDGLRELNEAIRLEPRHVPSRAHLYNALCIQQRYADAADTLQQITRLTPRNGSAWLALAWLRATCPDARVRSGEDALRHAQTARQLLTGDRYDVLDVLAAARAELGQFEEAVKVGSAAGALARKEGRDGKLAEIQERVDRYRNRQPCRAAPRLLRPGTAR